MGLREGSVGRSVTQSKWHLHAQEALERSSRPGVPWAWWLWPAFGQVWEEVPDLPLSSV